MVIKNNYAKLLAFLGFLSLVGAMFAMGCDDAPELPPCKSDDDCPVGYFCVAQESCAPQDPCASGFESFAEIPPALTADTLEDSDAQYQKTILYFQKDFTASNAGVSLKEDGSDTTLVIDYKSKVTLEGDFYNSPAKNEQLGVYVETRVKVEAPLGKPDSGECAVSIYLWPDNEHQGEICIGKSQVGYRKNATTFPHFDSGIDITDFHTYRLIAKNTAISDSSSAKIIVFELWIDGQQKYEVKADDFGDIPIRNDGAPAFGIRVNREGKSTWDYIRWGCEPDGGICPILPHHSDEDCAQEYSVGTTAVSAHRDEKACPGGHSAKKELCDYIDNDCDGLTDENFRSPSELMLEYEEHYFLEDPFGRFGETTYYLNQSCGVSDCQTARVICDPQNKEKMICAVGKYCGESADGMHRKPVRLTESDIQNWVSMTASEKTQFGKDACQTLRLLRPNDPAPFTSVEEVETLLNASGWTLKDLYENEPCDDADNNCDNIADEPYRLIDETIEATESLETDYGKMYYAGYALQKYNAIRSNDGSSATQSALSALGRPCGDGACNGGVVQCDKGHLEKEIQPDVGQLGQELTPAELLASPVICSLVPSVEVCCNGVDDDCNGETDEGCDKDGDGVQNCQGAELFLDFVEDCNDDDPKIYPEHVVNGQVIEGAKELCDGIDNDCDGKTDEDFDNDHDGYLNCNYNGCDHCLDPDDNDANTYPRAAEICDGKDNDNDGLIDEDFDFDQDSFATCPREGYPADCNDNDPRVNPLANELCDGIDNDCDGLVDEDFKVNGIYSTIEHCGECNRACRIEHATEVECKGGGCLVISCEDNYTFNSARTACDQFLGCTSATKNYEKINTLCREFEDGEDETSEKHDITKECYRTGRYQCQPGNETNQFKSSVVCVIPPNTPLDSELKDKGEICDGIDNTCDSVIDEGFLKDGVYSESPEHCGACNHRCDEGKENLHIQFKCSALGQCIEELSATDPKAGCIDGYWNLNGSVEDGCEYPCVLDPNEPNDDICNDMDGNCNGQVDENVDKMSLSNNCGTCGNVCGGDHMNGECVLGHCIDTCEKGYLNCTESSTKGCHDIQNIEHCSTCTDECNLDSADGCLMLPGTDNFQCTCGDGPACSGSKRFCVNATCIECRGEEDCPEDKHYCSADYTCIPCSRDKFAPKLCPPDKPICGDTNCKKCKTDDECKERDPSTPYCELNQEEYKGQCVSCATVSNKGCSGATPVCYFKNGSFTCGACQEDAEYKCANGLQCEDGGYCRGCNATTHAPCRSSSSPVCNPLSLTCEECRGSEQCVEVIDSYKKDFEKFVDFEISDGNTVQKYPAIYEQIPAECKSEDKETEKEMIKTEDCIKGLCKKIADITTDSNNNLNQSDELKEIISLCDEKDIFERTVCVDGHCQVCNLITHEGCGTEKLCNHNPDDFSKLTCTEPKVEKQCEFAGVRCGPNADSCVHRECRCGDHPACSGTTPYCVDGECVACCADGECEKDSSTEYCSVLNHDGHNYVCHPESHTCVECYYITESQQNTQNCQNSQPVCNKDYNVCRACSEDTECGDLNSERPVCLSQNILGLPDDSDASSDEQNVVVMTAAGSCVICDPFTNKGCLKVDSDGTIDVETEGTICRADVGKCQDCQSHAECNQFNTGYVCKEKTVSGERRNRCQPCNKNSDCNSHPNGNSCLNGICASCESDSDCPQVKISDKEHSQIEHSQICLRGACHQCLQHSDCPNNWICNDKLECESCSKDSDCEHHPNGAHCDKAVASNENDENANGSCVECTSNDHCNGRVCDITSHTCVDCESDEECNKGSNQTGGQTNESGLKCFGGMCGSCKAENENGRLKSEGCANPNPVCDKDKQGAFCRGCVWDNECESGYCYRGQCISCTPDRWVGLHHLGCYGNEDENEDEKNKNICRITEDNGALSGKCEQCTNDAECGSRLCDNKTGTCQVCKLNSNVGCLADSDSPICKEEVNGVNSCQPCSEENEAKECGGKQCVKGRCLQCDPKDGAGCCDPEDGAGCSENAYCNAAGECVTRCASDDECLHVKNTNKPYCFDGVCHSCKDNADCRTDRGSSVSNAPICGSDHACHRCENDSECDGVVPSGGQCYDGKCLLCNPSTHAGCDLRSSNPACKWITGGSPAVTACGQCSNSDKVCSPGGKCTSGLCVSGENDNNYCTIEEKCPNGGCKDGVAIVNDIPTVCNEAQPCEEGSAIVVKVCTPEHPCVSGKVKHSGCRGDYPYCQVTSQGTIQVTSCEKCLPSLSVGLSAGTVAPGCEGTGVSAGRGAFVCDPQDYECRECKNNDECGGKKCIQLDGQTAFGCYECIPGPKNEGCSGDKPYCEPSTGTCRACEKDSECAPGMYCVGQEQKVCRSCRHKFDEVTAADEGCSGSTPICDEATFECKACNATGVAEDACGSLKCATGGTLTGSCQACNPADRGVVATGCAASDGAGGDKQGGAFVCDTTSYSCRACKSNDECAVNQFCQQLTPSSESACYECELGTNVGCNESGKSYCDPATGTCEACTSDAHCANDPDGHVCVNGTCQTCNPGTDEDSVANEGCSEKTPFCAGGTQCRACAQNSDCSKSPFGNKCSSASQGDSSDKTYGQCVECNVDTDCQVGSTGYAICSNHKCVSCEDSGSLACSNHITNPNGAGAGAGDDLRHYCVQLPGAPLKGCFACKPGTNDGCWLDSNAPFCDPATAQCVGCDKNAHGCDSNPHGPNCVTDGDQKGYCTCSDDSVCNGGYCIKGRWSANIKQCYECVFGENEDYAINDGCNPHSDKPYCNPGTSTQSADPAVVSNKVQCTGCSDDNSCAGLTCVMDGANKGMCICNNNDDCPDSLKCGHPSNANGPNTCYQCTSNDQSNCSGATPICDTTTGSCRACTSSDSCGTGKVCYNGYCAGCDPTKSAQCSIAGEVCVPDVDNGAKCGACTNDAQCERETDAGGNYCIQGSCKSCRPSAIPGVVAEGCSSEVTDSSVTGSFVCDSSKSTYECKACTSHSDCPAALPYCVQETSENSPVAATGCYACDPNIPLPNRNGCNPDKPICGSGVCETCTSDSECGNGRVCTSSGTCAAATNQCKNNSDCPLEFYCVKKVNLNVDATGCYACNPDVTLPNDNGCNPDTPICNKGVCRKCTIDSDECGNGRVCTSSGTCAAATNP